jgi:hypothetical protein
MGRWSMVKESVGKDQDRSWYSQRGQLVKWSRSGSMVVPANRSTSEVVKIRIDGGTANGSISQVVKIRIDGGTSQPSNQ